MAHNETYDLLLSSDSSAPEILYKLAEAHLIMNDHQQAQTLLLSVLEEQPDNIEARYLLAQSYYDSSQINYSLREIDLLLRLDHNNAQAKILKNTITFSQVQEVNP